MATRVHYRGPRDAGGPGSGIGPGSDFVSTLFAATSLEGIEAVAAREATSSFGLRNLRLQASTPDNDAASAIDDPAMRLLPLQARKEAIIAAALLTLTSGVDYVVRYGARAWLTKRNTSA